MMGNLLRHSKSILHLPENNLKAQKIKFISRFNFKSLSCIGSRILSIQHFSLLICLRGRHSYIILSLFFHFALFYVGSMEMVTKSNDAFTLLIFYLIKVAQTVKQQNLLIIHQA